MYWPCEKTPHIGVLDDLSCIKHTEGIADFAYDPQIVGYKQQGRAVPRLHLCDQFQDLLLHRDIKSSGRFVRNDQFRLCGKS